MITIKLRQDLEKIYEDLLKNNKNKQVIVVNKAADKIIKEKVIEENGVFDSLGEMQGLNQLAGYEYYVEKGNEDKQECIVVDAALYENLRSLPEGVEFWETINNMMGDKQ